MPKKPIFTISFISWMVFVAFSSLYSFEDTSVPTINIPHLDKVVHFTFYFVAAILGLLSFRMRLTQGTSLRKITIVMLLFLIIFGIIIEVMQYGFTTSREGDIFDALANTLGALAGVLTAKMLFSSKNRLNWK
ncbi:VanZ family protein [Ulvibacterium sp.]|uniref:VanZ family protein n=1 Tax=Ulvibacterium sp. TaxID=2665914 RepID=UPI003CC64A0D